MHPRILLPFIVSLAAAASALAQSSLVTTASFAIPSSSTVPPTQWGSPAALTGLTKFDSTLGTLHSVSVEFDSTIDASISVYNSLGTAQTVNNAFVSNLVISLGGPEGTGHSFTYNSTTANPVVAAPGFNYYNPISDTITSSAFASNLAPYEANGGGVLNLSLSDSAVGTYGGSPGGVVSNGFGSLFYGGFADATGTVKITYLYTAIPEPSAYAAILGVATLAFATLRRKRALA